MTPQQITIAGIIATILVGGAVQFSSVSDCETARAALVSKMENRTLTPIEAGVIAKIATDGCGVGSTELGVISKKLATSLLWSDDLNKVWYSWAEYKLK